VEPQIVASATHIPASPLEEYIECLWYHQIRGYSGRELILPSPYIELILNFADPHKVLDPADFTRFQWQRQGWLAGMQTRVLPIESTSSHMIGARFKPGGAHAFVPAAVSDFTDRVMPFEQIYGADAASLHARLLAEPSIEPRFAIFEEFLAARFAPDEDAYALVRAAVAALQASKGAQPLSEISAALNVSHKHFTQQFTRLVGLRPKQFARLVRLNGVLTGLDVSQPVDWNAVAHAADFYDQSHFINEFRAFTGITPGEYLLLWKLLQERPVDYDPRFLPIG
jgi:AraC-like DNA-binding protein